MEDVRKYTYAQLLEMEGQEIKFRNSFEQVRVDNVYIYNVESVKIRGLRGLFVYIDLFGAGNKNISTIMVFTDSQLEVFDISYPGFKISPK